MLCKVVRQTVKFKNVLYFAVEMCTKFSGCPHICSVTDTAYIPVVILLMLHLNSWVPKTLQKRIGI